MTKLEQKFQKRKRISKNDMLNVLKDSYRELFIAYYEAVEMYNEEIQAYPLRPEVRSRILTAMLTARITDSFISHFPEKWTKGKYGRIIFRWDGISLLIKKLNQNGKPSYIPTILSDGITNQLQMPLFDCEEAKEDSILFFGYTKDKLGQLSNPRIVFYDDGVQWVADASELTAMPSVQKIEKANVRLKKKEIKKAE